MMMKGSSSTLLCALLGLTVLLCVVNEGQGLQCFKKDGDSPTEREITCPSCPEAGFLDTYKFAACFKNRWLDEDASKSSKGCDCNDNEDDKCFDADGYGGRRVNNCQCNTDRCNGARTTTRTLAFSTLLSASALVTITSSFWNWTLF